MGENDMGVDGRKKALQSALSLLQRKVTSILVEKSKEKSSKGGENERLIFSPEETEVAYSSRSVSLHETWAKEEGQGKSGRN